VRPAIRRKFVVSVLSFICIGLLPLVRLRNRKLQASKELLETYRKVLVASVFTDVQHWLT